MGDLMTKSMTQLNKLELLEGLGTAVIWLNAQQQVKYFNFAAAELLQLSPSKVIGVNWRLILPGLLDDVQRCGTGRLTLHDMEVTLVDGSKNHVTCMVSYFEMDAQDGWLIELYDTERHHRIVDEEERWHQYEAGSLLVQTLAHEVKNPLAGIYGAAQLLRKRLPENEKVRSYIDIIASEVKRLQSLVDTMLGPKVSQDQSALASHDLHDLIAYVLQVIEGEKPPGVFVKLDCDPSIPEIALDFDAMVQALLNLVKNALQAMQTHGGLLTIKTRVQYKFTLGNKTYPLVAVLSVIDEGEGIPANYLDSIFYPMVTHKPQGSGLGLPVSQNIVRQHGGLIVAESEPGNTVFHIYLPIERNTPKTDNRSGA